MAGTSVEQLVEIVPASPLHFATDDIEDLPRDDTVSQALLLEASSVSSLIHLLTSKTDDDPNRVLECRLLAFHAVFDNITVPSGATGNRTTLLAQQSSGLPVQFVSCFGVPFNGLVRDTESELLWPSHNSMLRFVQCAHDLSNDPSFLSRLHLSTFGAVLFHSVPISIDADSNVVTAPSSLCDVVTTWAHTLDHVCDLHHTALPDFGRDAAKFRAVITEAHPALRAAVADLCALASSERERIKSTLRSTSAQVFFACAVHDALTANTSISEAVALASRYSRAIFVLLWSEPAHWEPDDSLSVYDMFSPDDALLIRRHLHNTFCNGDSYSTLASAAPPFPPTAAINLEAYDQLTEQNVEPGDLAEPGRGATPDQNLNLVCEGIYKEESVEGNTYQLSAVVIRRRLRTTKTRMLPGCVARGTERARRAFRGGSLGLSVGPARADLRFESGSGNHDEYVINAFLSGRCGLQPAMWMLKCLTRKTVAVAADSPISLKNFMRLSNDDNAPVLTTFVSAELMSRLPVLVDFETKATYVVVDTSMDAKKIRIRQGLYYIEQDDVEMDERRMRKGVLKRSHCLG